VSLDLSGSLGIIIYFLRRKYPAGKTAKGLRVLPMHFFCALHHALISQKVIFSKWYRDIEGNSVFFPVQMMIRDLQWELATGHGFLNYDTISKFHQAEFLMFGLVFVSSDFEFGRNISSEELTVCPIQG